MKALSKCLLSKQKGHTLGLEAEISKALVHGHEPLLETGVVSPAVGHMVAKVVL